MERSQQYAHQKQVSFAPLWLLQLVGLATLSCQAALASISFSSPKHPGKRKKCTFSRKIVASHCTIQNHKSFGAYLEMHWNFVSLTYSHKSTGQHLPTGKIEPSILEHETFTLKTESYLGLEDRLGIITIFKCFS